MYQKNTAITNDEEPPVKKRTIYTGDFRKCFSQTKDKLAFHKECDMTSAFYKSKNKLVNLIETCKDLQEATECLEF
ncbi:hypothetical protein PV328_011085 [Microctonus aethiopoides]|uniref:Uncharacterized protein n=1 Tax=Microctonus aethiopoides TaxID=144406 RepID=A0AA39C3P8_9HYME|nr:hypothetical protein PV328_011085 [Microctonus aethiopoides]